MTSISIIVAIGSDNSIGRNGNLAFHISADLKRFKALTMGWPIIMGRKTFESLPKGALPGRRNIVITRNAQFQAAGAEVAGSLSEALDMVRDSEKAFIIGGGSIYREAMPLAHTLELTCIYATASDADTFFPEIDINDWTVEASSDIEVDQATGLPYCFKTLVRKV